MGKGCAGSRLPVRGFLQVECLVGRSVHSLRVLAVGIHHGPVFARQALSLVVEHIHLSYRGNVLAVDGIHGLETDVAAAHR